MKRARRFNNGSFEWARGELSIHTLLKKIGPAVQKLWPPKVCVHSLFFMLPEVTILGYTFKNFLGGGPKNPPCGRGIPPPIPIPFGDVRQVSRSTRCAPP